ncbi:MAG: insulinase family protein [Spirochaetes bacterium]|nr:insulinase family protein [Spirochaetota bacterium]
MKGATIQGFLQLAERAVDEYRCRARVFRHAATGCEVLHLASADTENLFAFSFATPALDDTGAAHILEHSVLAGSARFPLREPFTVLMRGSVSTFLNAFTYPDHTVYPAASCTPRDFFNLLDVYGDAVFFPLLRDETFRQEGWRLENAAGRAGFAGVVLNEMKGAYASPEALAGEWALRALFPDTPLGRDSGGDPRAIPMLTPEGLRAYHRRWYHPSNCRIFLYGDIPVEEELAFLQERFLSSFAAERIDARLPEPSPWTAPARLERTFPVPAGTPTERRSTVAVSWLGPSVADREELLALEVLSDALVGTPGSPLWKALTDSGLGEDVAPVTGLETEACRAVFSVGLRGTEPDRADDVERLVLGTLATLAERGIGERVVASTLNRVEFRHREIRGNGSPYALRLMRRVLRGWSNGADPVDSLEFTPVMATLKRRLAADGRFFERLAAGRLLGNLHRATLVVRPDAGQEARDAADERGRIAAVQRRISAADRARQAAEQRAFETFQSRVETPEELALIPVIGRAALRREPEVIPVSEGRLACGAPLLRHDLFTNGVVYVDLCFRADGLTERQSLLLPLLARAVCGCGVPGAGYAATALELFRLTGGLTAVLDAGATVENPGGVSGHLFLRTRALRPMLSEALALVAGLAAGADFRDLARLRDIVLELRNDLKAALLPAGTRFAALRAGSRVSAAMAVEERWHGISQLEFLHGLSDGLEGRLGSLAAELEELRAILITRDNVLFNVTDEADGFGEAERSLEAVHAVLPAAGIRAETAGIEATASAWMRAESLAAGTPVGYASRVVPGFPWRDRRSVHASVLGHLLTTGTLWEKIRREGGAYGAWAYPRPVEGLFVLGSYRDPKIARTLGAFRAALEDFAVSGPEADEVERAVVGTVGREDHPLDPGEKGFLSLQRRLRGIGEPDRLARRRLVLDCTGRDLAAAASGLLDGWDRGSTAVLAGRAAIDEAVRDLPELADAVREVPV